MSTDVALHAPPNGIVLSDSPLVQWAYEAQQANKIALSLAKTSFVPATMKGKPDDITAAILAGQELGLKPMASLRSMDIISGTPALRAHAMRGLVQSHGHEVVVTESTETRCVMRGRRRGTDDWQESRWTIERAKKLGLAGKSEWQKQPQTMLVARATGEICRLIAADVLYAMPYAAEELGDDLPASVVQAEVTPRRTAKRAALPAPAPELMPPDEAEPDPEPTGDDPPEPDLDDDWPDTPQPPDAAAPPVPDA
jgi:hypothetical protein